MKICVIGPVSPFRSGIARHTTALVRALSARPDTDVSVVSFSRQYPRSLFPGASDIDPAAAQPEGVETRFILDTVNPLSWRRVARAALDSGPDLAVIPAWTFFTAPCLGYLARALRRAGIPVAMVVHNAEDHEAAGWKRRLSRFQLHQATRFVTHNASIAADLHRLVPGVSTVVQPHPVYDDYPKPRGTLQREAGLELLFFGLVRPYKGLDIALTALARARRRDIRLAIVGEFWQGRAETEALISEHGLRDSIELVPRYVADHEAAEYFARADVVVAPYRTATGSGVLALAQWYRRPVIVSDTPGLAETVVHGRNGWIFPVDDAESLSVLLDECVTRQAADAMGPALEQALEVLSWPRFAEAVIAP